MAAGSAGTTAAIEQRFTTVVCNQRRYRTVASERKSDRQPTSADAGATTAGELYETFVNLGGVIQSDQPYDRLTVGLQESPRRTVVSGDGQYCIVGVRCQPSVGAYTLVLQRDGQPPVSQRYVQRPCVPVVYP